MTTQLEHAGDRWRVSGNMTIAAAAGLLAAGKKAVSSQSACFDLANVQDIDSSGLAVLFGWQREAKSGGKNLQILNPPPNLVSLAGVYGVTDLLALA